MWNIAYNSLFEILHVFHEKVSENSKFDFCVCYYPHLLGLIEKGKLYQFLSLCSLCFKTLIQIPCKVDYSNQNRDLASHL